MDEDDSKQKKGDEEQDLLKSTLYFNKFFDKQNTYPIFTKVREGLITEINEKFHQWSLQPQNIDNIAKSVNAIDDEGKTPLHYSTLQKFNLALFFLIKGANPYITARDGKTIFHVGCFMGHVELISLVLNYIRHQDRMNLQQEIQAEMRKFKFKHTDVKNGILISSDKHMKPVIDRFTNFQTVIYEILDRFYENWLNNYKNIIEKLDNNERNPIHYACIDKFTKCGATSNFLLDSAFNSKYKKLQNEQFQSKGIHAKQQTEEEMKKPKYGVENEANMPGYQEFFELYNEVQLLELDKEKRIDPRQYLQIFEKSKNFLKEKDWEEIQKKYKEKRKKNREDVINQQDADGLTPLHLASFNGDFPQVQILLKFGANPKLTDNKRKKAVLDFAESDNVRKYLIDLQKASLLGDTKSLSLLVNCGHDLNGKKSIFGVAPIHNAIISKQTQKPILDYLISCDANLDIADSNGWTPLHHACKKGDIESVKTLIEKGAQLLKFSNKGYYPIHIAALYNQFQVIQFILNHDIINQPKANIESKDNQQCSALLLAAKKGNYESIQTLFENNANLYSTDMHNWNALHHAVFNKQIKCINQLCKYDNDREQLRNMANKKSQLPKQLINDKEVQFAFHTPWNAAGEGNLDIVRRLFMLKDGKADFDQQTKLYGWTPLHLAVKGKYYLVVKFLVENGVKLDIDAGKRLGIKSEEEIQTYQNENFFTAKGYALELEDKKLIALLTMENEQDQEN